MRKLTFVRLSVTPAPPTPRFPVRTPPVVRVRPPPPSKLRLSSTKPRK